MALRKRQLLIDKYQTQVAILLAVLIWLLVLVLVMYGVHRDYQASKYHLGKLKDGMVKNDWPNPCVRYSRTFWGIGL